MKSYVTSGTGSQQTLTGSQDEKVAIYQTLADAEADLANLEAGQIVATPDTGDENAQPVDVIQAGNMHAVTSNAVAQELNSPFTRNIVINANANSILHIGSFTPAQANIIGASLEIQVKLYDGCYRTLATISYGNIRIGLLEGNETYCQLSLYKTSDTRYDLYLKTSSSQNCNAFIQITNPLNFTYDGSIVNDYSGTFVTPTYNNSINSVTANNMQSVTSGAVYNALGHKINYEPRSDLSDCNSASDGFYCSNNVANTPDNTTGYIFILTLSYNNDDSYRVQFCMLINNNDIYVRNKIAGTWTAWAKKSV